MMTKPVALGVLLFVAGIVVGRVSVLMTQPAASTTTSSSSPSMPMAAPSAPMMAAPSGAGGAARGGVLRGQIAEVIQVPQYTYVRFESGEWAAVSSAPSLAVGQSVGVSLQTEMIQFASASLGRTFPRIWFGSLEGSQPAAPREMEPEMAMPKPVAAPEVKAALKAVQSSNAPMMRVVDVYSEKGILAGTRVKVKGTVDRSSFVQGLNYVHLKDGTGSATDKTDDLLCLSSSDVPKGTVVTMEGVVALNKDLGMGPLPVVLSDAAAK